MNKEKILKLINQQIEIAVKKLKQEMQIGKTLDSKDNGDSSDGKETKFRSLQEFIDEKNPRSVASKEMPVLAYYLREIDKRKLCEVDEKIIKIAYKKTNRSRPKRLKQAFVDSCYFDKVSGRPGFYRLNDDGDYFVEVNLKEKKK